MRGNSLTSYCTSGSVGFSGMVWTKVFKFDVMHCSSFVLLGFGVQKPDAKLAKPLFGDG
jgi:hypothetical protein